MAEQASPSGMNDKPQRFTGLFEWNSPYTHVGRRIAWKLDVQPDTGLCEIADLREKPDGSFQRVAVVIMSWEAAQAFADAIDRHRSGA